MMKRLLFLTLIAATALSQWTKVDSTSSFNAGRRIYNTNDSVFAGVVKYAQFYTGASASTKITNAIADLPASGGIVDARGLYGAQTFVGDPMADVGSKSVTLILGYGTYTTSSTVSIPTKCQIIGQGRGDSATAGTVIKAASNFGQNQAVVYLGSSSSAFDSRLEDLTVDASRINGSIGVMATHTQEMSGMRRVLVTNYDSIGVWWKSPSTTAQNSFMENCEVYASNVCAATAIGVWAQGVYNLKIDKLTLNTNGSAQAAVGLRVDGSQGFYNSIHIERHTTGILIGQSVAVDNLALIGISGHTIATVTDLIKISPNTSSQNISIISVNKGLSTNAILDSIGMPTLPFTATAVGFYFLGNGSGSSKTRFHSDATIFKSIIGQLSVGGTNTQELLQLVRETSTIGSLDQLAFYMNAYGGSVKYGGFSIGIVDSSSTTTHDGAAYIHVAKNGTQTLVATIDSGGINIATGETYRINGIAISSVTSAIKNLTGTAIPWDSASSFRDTLSAGSTTYTFSNVPTTYLQTIRVNIFNLTGGVTVTWPATVKWYGGVTPTLAGKDSLTIFEFSADAMGQVSGKLANYYVFATATADTAHPEKPVVTLLENGSASAVIAWQPPSGNPGNKSYIVKVSQGTAIGTTTVTSGGTSYPTVTRQEISIPSFTSGVNEMSVTLSTVVDPTKTFVTPATFSASLDEASKTYLKVSLSSDGRTVYLKKTSAAGGSTLTNINFSVMSFSKWVTVQHKNDSTFTTANNILNIPITAVTVNKSFPITTVTMANTSASSWNFAMSEITSTTNLRVTLKANPSATLYVGAQVVTVDSALVTTLSGTLAATDTMTTVTISPKLGAYARSFSVFTYNMSSDVSATNMSRQLLSGRITSDSTYVIEREGQAATYAMNYNAFLVTFKSGWPITVERLNRQFTSSDLSLKDTIVGGSVTKSFVWGNGNMFNRGITTGTTDSTVSATFSLVQADSTVTISRVPLGYTTTFWGEGITFPTGVGGGADTVAFDSVTTAQGVMSEVAGGQIGFRFDVEPSTAYYVSIKAVGVNDSLSVMSTPITFTSLALPSASNNNGDKFIDSTSGSDSNTGLTAASPVRTWAKLMQLVQTGDTIRAKGTFVEPVTITQDSITIKAWAGQSAGWTFSGRTGTALTIKANNVTIDSLFFTGGTQAISSSRTSGGVVKNSRFSKHYAWEEVRLMGCKDWKFLTNDFNPTGSRVISQTADPNSGNNGIWITYDPVSGVQSERILIEGNTFHDFGHASVTTASQTRGVVIKGNTMYSGKIGVTIGYQSNSCLVENNTIYWCPVMGMISGHGGDGAHISADSTIFRFNVVYRDTVLSLTGFADPYLMNTHSLDEGGNPSTLRQFRVYNNTIVNDVQSFSTGYMNAFAYRHYQQTSVAGTIISDVKLRNNILVGYDSTVFQINQAGITLSAAMKQLELKNNIFSRLAYSSGKKLIQSYTTSGNNAHLTLAAAIAAYPTTFYSSNLDSDPLFTDTTNNDWHPTASSPAVNGGTFLTTASAAGTASTSLPVDDPNWFSDGLGVQPGDLITISGSTPSTAVRVIGKSGSTLILGSARTWSNGASIYYGTDITPNIGAF